MLFVGKKAVGVIEAKPEGTTLGGVDSQSGKYAASFPEQYPHAGPPLPFVYESTGVETLFRDLRDPAPRSRRVFAFHKPETLAKWADSPTLSRSAAPAAAAPDARTAGLPDRRPSRASSSRSRDARPRALIQMATGSGKTFTAVSFIYRLIKLWRGAAGALPGGPGHSRDADGEGVRAVSPRPMTAGSSQSSTTSST